MENNLINEPMMEFYLFESNQQVEQLEQILIKSEQTGSFDVDEINEIFRIMHTLKGSSAMMMFDNLAHLAHSVEDLFAFLRENPYVHYSHSTVVEILLESTDFVKEELSKIANGASSNGISENLVKKIKSLLLEVNSGSNATSTSDNLEKNPSVENQEYIPQEKQQYYVGYAKKEGKKENILRALVKFENDCEMENIRAFGIVHGLKDIVNKITHIPVDIISDDSACEYIRNNGFEMNIFTDMEIEEIKSILMQTVFIKNIEIEEITESTEQIQISNPTAIELEDTEIKIPAKAKAAQKSEEAAKANVSTGGMISVSVKKLDSLMDLVGELMISGLMVTRNSHLNSPEFNEFKKQARIHGKLISELQDISMSLRMVPLSATFNKMTRIIRDVSKKLDKEIHLQIVGEETEIDKNIVESISDPLMHLVRNAADHGIESKEERNMLKKNPVATITLEAKNVGGEVWIIVKDDGKGLDKERIYEKANSKGLVSKKQSDMTDDEIFSLVFFPGFSTKENVTEFSGRGVGLDVVMKNIREIGGSVAVNSVFGTGTTFTIKIPLTLAIVGGMIIRVGESRYALPTMSVSECFRPASKDLITDPDGFESVMVRGECFPIIRVHETFNVKTKVTEFTEGILIMVENQRGKYCIFADELVEEVEVVVKPLPNYIDQKISGISGCTLLGDGSISLIIDLESLVA